MKRFLVVVALGGVPCSLQTSVAQPLDCDHLIHSKIPFQITRTGGFAQIYRSDNLMVTTYASNSNGVNKSVMQGGLLKSSIAPNGKHFIYEYDVHPKGFYFETEKRIERVTRMDDYKAKPERLEIELLPDDDISVGPCIFHVSHYKLRIPDNATGLQSDEIWYSKDLMAALNSTHILRDKEGKEVIKKVEATDITTEFVPVN